MKFLSKIVLMSLVMVGLSCDTDDDTFRWNCKQNSEAIHISYDANQELEIRVDHTIDGKFYEAYGFYAFQEGKSDDKTRASINMAFNADTLATIYAFYPATKYVIRAYDNSENPSPDCWEKKFTTVCAPFKFLYVGKETSSSVYVTWNIEHYRSSNANLNLSQFNLFTVNLRKKGQSEVTLLSTDEHELTLTGLTSNTEYEVQLVYTCTDNNVYPTEWKTFRTL